MVARFQHSRYLVRENTCDSFNCLVFSTDVVICWYDGLFFDVREGGACVRYYTVSF